MSRIIVYIETINFAALSEEKGILGAGILFAFVGTYFGKELVKKTTLKGIQKVVGVLLFLLGTLFILCIL